MWGSAVGQLRDPSVTRVPSVSRITWAWGHVTRLGSVSGCFFLPPPPPAAMAEEEPLLPGESPDPPPAP